MPVFRSGGLGHRAAARDLRRGRYPVSPVNDESVLWYITPEDDPVLGPAPHSMNALHIFEYRPFMIFHGVLAWCGISFLLPFTLMYFAHGHTHYAWLSGFCAVLVVYAVWAFIIRKPRKFFVFDRDRGLVHIPHILGRGMDVARWEDLSFVIVDEPGGYAGLSPVTSLFVVRPGHDLLRDGYPPRHMLVRVCGGSRETNAAEEYWACLVRFMNSKELNSGFSPEDYRDYVKEGLAQFGGDLSKYYTGGLPRYSHFNYYRLVHRPTWWREPDGRWRPAREGDWQEVLNREEMVCLS